MTRRFGEGIGYRRDDHVIGQSTLILDNMTLTFIVDDVSENVVLDPGDAVSFALFALNEETPILSVSLGDGIEILDQGAASPADPAKIRVTIDDELWPVGAAGEFTAELKISQLNGQVHRAQDTVRVRKARSA